MLGRTISSPKEVDEYDFGDLIEWILLAMHDRWCCDCDYHLVNLLAMWRKIFRAWMTLCCDVKCGEDYTYYNNRNSIRDAIVTMNKELGVCVQNWILWQLEPLEEAIMTACITQKQSNEWKDPFPLLLLIWIMLSNWIELKIVELL